MREFIISILSLMGFGVNGVMFGGDEFFVSKLHDYVPNMDIAIESSNDSGMTVSVTASDGDKFCIIYTYCEGTRRIKSVEII